MRVSTEKVRTAPHCNRLFSIHTQSLPVLSSPSYFDMDLKIISFSRRAFIMGRSVDRYGSVGGHEYAPHHAHSYDRFPAIFCDRVPRTSRSARYRSRRRHGVVNGGATGAGCIPTRRSHKEDQSRTAGKSGQIAT